MSASKTNGLLDVLEHSLFVCVERGQHGPSQSLALNAYQTKTFLTSQLRIPPERIGVGVLNVSGVLPTTKLNVVIFREGVGIRAHCVKDAYIVINTNMYRDEGTPNYAMYDMLLSDKKQTERMADLSKTNIVITAQVFEIWISRLIGDEHSSMYAKWRDTHNYFVSQTRHMLSQKRRGVGAKGALSPSRQSPRNRLPHKADIMIVEGQNRHGKLMEPLVRDYSGVERPTRWLKSIFYMEPKLKKHLQDQHSAIPSLLQVNGINITPTLAEADTVIVRSNDLERATQKYPTKAVVSLEKLMQSWKVKNFASDRDSYASFSSDDEQVRAYTKSRSAQPKRKPKRGSPRGGRSAAAAAYDPEPNTMHPLPPPETLEKALQGLKVENTKAIARMTPKQLFVEAIMEQIRQHAHASGGVERDVVEGWYDELENNPQYKSVHRRLARMLASKA